MARSRQRHIQSVKITYEYDDGTATTGEIRLMETGRWHWLFRNVFRALADQWWHAEVAGYGEAESYRNAFATIAELEGAKSRELPRQ